MNIPLLRRIQRQIDKAPHRFAMSHFCSNSDYDCSTSFCIAGWACVLSGHVEKLKDIGVVENAINILELDKPGVSNQWHRLFYDNQWPEQFRGKDDKSEASAFRAIARIEHFIATEGRE